MDLSQQITRAQTARDEKLSKLSQLVERIAVDERDFSDEETKLQDELTEEINRLNRTIDGLERAEKTIGASAVPVSPKVPANNITTKYVRQKGTFFAREALLLLKTRGNRYEASRLARQLYDDVEMENYLRTPEDVIEKAFAWPDMIGKAVVTPTSTGSGVGEALVPVVTAAAEFIEMLRALSVMARVPCRRLTFGVEGSIKLPKQLTGASGNWIGESKPIPVARQTFGALTLTPKKMAVLTVVPNELVRHSSPAAEAIIRDDLLMGCAETLDTAFADATDLSATRPEGLAHITTAISASTATANLDKMSADANAALAAMDTAKIPLRQPIWLMPPTLYRALQFARDSLGNHVYMTELASGTWYGVPYLVSTAVVADTLILLEGSQFVIAEDLTPRIEVSDQATIMMSSAPGDTLDAHMATGRTTDVVVHSLWQQDEQAFRCILAVDWIARYDAAVQNVASVGWAP